MKRFDFESMLDGGLGILVEEAARQQRFKSDLLFVWSAQIADNTRGFALFAFATDGCFVDGKTPVMVNLRRTDAPSFACFGLYRRVILVKVSKTAQFTLYDVTCCAPEFLEEE